jgi:hypothetical protein
MVVEVSDWKWKKSPKGEGSRITCRLGGEVKGSNQPVAVAIYKGE